MRKFLLACAFGCVAPAAFAADQIMASDPQAVVDFLTSEGVETTLTTDDYDDPKIKMEYDGHRFSLYFYGCKDNVDCQSIQFYVGYQTEGSWSKEAANDWNMNRRYGKAYISDAGSSRLEYDVHTGDYGVHRDDFTEMFQTWIRLKVRFEQEIDW